MRKRQRPDFKSALNQAIRTCDIEEIRVRLEAPFHPNEVDWRVGASSGQNADQQWTNQAWAYIDARDVQRRLDRVVGFGLWDSKIRVEGAFIICDLKLKFEWDWVNRSDGTHIGDVDIDTTKKGSQNRTENREFEKTKDNTVMETKGSYSIAFKRAAVKWGIGTYLYDLPKPVRPTDAKTRQFGAWALIEFWMIAAHAYAEYREEVGAEWSGEEKGEDFAVWTRRKGIDMSEVVDTKNRLIFDTPERLTAWCVARGMDPEKVPFTRNRNTHQAAAPTDTKSPERAAQPATPSTAAVATSPTTGASSPPPTPISLHTPAPVAVSTAPTPTPASTAAPTSTATTPTPVAQPNDVAINTIQNLDAQIKAATMAEDLTKLIISICGLVPKNLATVPQASVLMETLYLRFMVLVQQTRTVVGPDADTIWKLYREQRKQMDPAWQPPTKAKKQPE